VDAQQQRLKVKAVWPGNDDLAIEHAALGQVRLERRRQLREVAIEGLEVAALDEHLVAVAEDDRAEAVPLWFEQPAVRLRDAVRKLREHGFKRWLERQTHLGDSSVW